MEIGRSIEFLCSSLRIYEGALSHLDSLRSIALCFSFLGAISGTSKKLDVPIDLGASISMHTDFASHMNFGRDGFTLLSEEIDSNGEYLNANIYLVDTTHSSDDNGGTLPLVATAVVGMWVMLEDGCNVVRQELDIVTVETQETIGTVVVDVRGHALLSNCS